MLNDAWKLGFSDDLRRLKLNILIWNEQNFVIICM